MVSGGADINSVKHLLGHASLATTQIYTHLDLSTLRRDYARAHPRGGTRIAAEEHEKEHEGDHDKHER